MSERQAPYPTGSPPIALMQCPIAGFQYHGGQACLGRVRIDDRLELHREPGNRHDPRAITVQWQGVMLGYVPREANYALSQMMDRGARAQARVKSLRAGADPWHRVMMEVSVHAAAPPREPAKEPEVMFWVPAKTMAPLLMLLPANGGLTRAQQETAIAVLQDCLPEIARRLARPAVAILHDDRREVHLWDTLALEIRADGTCLAARWLHGSPAAAPSLTLDLKQPLSAEACIACLVAPIAETCARHGLTKASLGEPLQRWIGNSLRLTLDGAIDFEALRKWTLERLAPDPLARSLANRIFEASPSAEAFNWVCAHAPALALCGVEQPEMLPFLRLVQDDKAMQAAPDPLAALRERLLAQGIEPTAWKKFARWGFDAFERMGPAWWKPIPFARFANLLHHLDVQAPSPHFAPYALTAALYDLPTQARLDFERHPLWFMRALLREVERLGDAVARSDLRNQLCGCVDWLLDARPEPDANQQRAGWAWIMEQAYAYRGLRELALAAPWSVPVAGMLWGAYRVVAIDGAAALAAEALAMKNCLATYEVACRSGDVAVYSIRDRSTGARIACFAAERVADDDWQLIEVAGKMNAMVDDELERIGHAMVVKLNGGRGGEVVPF
ncbi:MAG TPA: HIRAN domain-containing protein [Usitatibacter sp.]|nr:HIRAN domain-containing protein [Usitatibacter sp.]